jgi:protein TonB
MAPQTRIEETVPSTLPDDFGEWDGGVAAAPPSTLPDDFEGFDSGPAAVLESPAPKAVAVPPAVTKTPDFPAMRSPVVKPTPTPAPTPAPVQMSRKAERAARHAQPVARAKAEEVPAPRPIHQVKAEPVATETGKSKKTMVIAGIGAAVLVIVLLAVLIPMMRRKPAANSNLVVVSHPVMSQPGTEAPLDQPVTKPVAATPLQQTTTAATVATPAPTTPVPVKSDLMNSQLNAPSRISKDLKNQDSEAAPSSNFAAGGLEGLGGSGGGVGAGMGSHAAPNVKFASPKFVTISSGVAQGMLVQRTTPNYPAIAKTARVAGTVVLEATISKSGSIESVKAVSGPEMLRQAAVDAVRSWRYKPYMLDNQPIEMQTTVNVVFSLGGS